MAVQYGGLMSQAAGGVGNAQSRGVGGSGRAGAGGRQDSQRRDRSLLLKKNTSAYSERWKNARTATKREKTGNAIASCST